MATETTRGRCKGAKHTRDKDSDAGTLRAHCRFVDAPVCRLMEERGRCAPVSNDGSSRFTRSCALVRNTLSRENSNAESKPPTQRMLVSKKDTGVCTVEKSRFWASQVLASLNSSVMPIIHSVSNASTMVMPIPTASQQQKAWMTISQATQEHLRGRHAPPQASLRSPVSGNTSSEPQALVLYPFHA